VNRGCNGSTPLAFFSDAPKSKQKPTVPDIVRQNVKNSPNFVF
jgi:hypothetical protein